MTFCSSLFALPQKSPKESNHPDSIPGIVPALVKAKILSLIGGISDEGVAECEWQVQLRPRSSFVMLSHKTFLKKTRRGKVIKVVREHYLR
jgi:hypothetical protein